MDANDRMAKLEKMLEAEPDDTFCLYSLAQEHAKRDDHDRAIEYYDRVLAIDENYLYAYFHKAKSLEAVDRMDDAKAELQRGVARARQAGDDKALGELGEYLTTLNE
ncbi:MAG: tetratricopeptide repeat protein [Phycisphaerales bacterium]